MGGGTDSAFITPPTSGISATVPSPTVERVGLSRQPTMPAKLIAAMKAPTVPMKTMETA